MLAALRAPVEMHMQFGAPVAVVLVIDTADGNTLAREHCFHRFTAGHGQLDQFDRLFPVEMRAVFNGDLRINDDVAAVAA